MLFCTEDDETQFIQLATTFAEVDYMAAEEVAEYYHDYCDGWESRWPLKIGLKKRDVDPVTWFEVSIEAVPSFNATEVKETQP